MEKSLSEKELVEMLKSLVEWWEAWENSPNPSDLEDPPIEEAKALLIKNGIEIMPQPHF